jgi:PEP-CTERM motif
MAAPADRCISPENQQIRPLFPHAKPPRSPGRYSHQPRFKRFSSSCSRYVISLPEFYRKLRKLKFHWTNPPAIAIRRNAIWKAVVFGGKTLDLKGKQVMKAKILAFAAATSLLTGLSTARANVTGISYAPDGSGAINCPIYNWPGGTDVNIYGYQYSGPGAIDFNVATDTSGDPTLTLGNNIVNDTGFAWSGYEVTVTMGQTFTLSSALVTVPPDWTVSSIVQPGAPVLGQFTGNIFLSAGTPVQVGQSLDFSYQLSFLGSVAFTETLTPTPEPGTCSLLLGGLALGGWIARRHRS